MWILTWVLGGYAEMGSNVHPWGPGGIAAGRPGYPDAGELPDLWPAHHDGLSGVDYFQVRSHVTNVTVR